MYLHVETVSQFYFHVFSLMGLTLFIVLLHGFMFKFADH